MRRIARCREQVGLFEPSRGVVIIFGRTSVRGGANLVAQRTCQLFTQHFSPLHFHIRLLPQNGVTPNV